MSRAALVVLVVLAGCRRPPDAALPVVIAPALGEPPHETVAPAPLARGPSQTIDIRYDRAADAWDVTWTFAEPTLGLVFDRRKPRFRTATWTAAPGAHWAIEGDAETLRADDETARTTFAVRFATDDASRQRAMPLNLRWRDGGRLLFTGSLGGHALVCGPTACTRRDVGTERIWQISAAGELRILATTGRDTLTWHEPMGELRGTYLYVGARTATDVAEVTTLVDRGVPAWLAAATQRDLPPLLASYAARTGVALPFRPLVLISRGPSTARRRRGVRGSALPGLVQLEANGGGWDRDGRAARRQWFELVAHEAFHLWNSQLARRAEVRDEWWSEGASSYVAGRALRDAGYLDARRYQRRMLRAANACLRSLRGPLLDEAAEASYYTCGELVHFVVDRRVSGGVWPIYAALFAGAQVQGTYATADFVALLGDAALVADLEQILGRGLGDQPARFVQRLLAGAGLATRIDARRHRPVRLVAASGTVGR